jgi:hypothetical protein
MKKLQIQIAAAAYEPGSNKNKIILLTSGPMVNADLNEESIEVVHKLAGSLLDLFLLQLPQAAQESLPSLPEKIAEQPRYLDVARQMLAKVESGKLTARCVAYEQNGDHYILIATRPEDK